MQSITDLQTNESYKVDGVGVMTFKEVVSKSAKIVKMETKDFTYYAELKQLQPIK
jgi:hypothetical protein